MVLGACVPLALFVLSIYAVIRALQCRKSRNASKRSQWFVLGGLGAVYLAIIGLGVGIGLVRGFQAGFAMAHGRQLSPEGQPTEVTGTALPYRITFPGGWSVVPKRVGSTIDLMVHRQSLYFTISADEASFGDTDLVTARVRKYIESISTEQVWGPTETVVIDGRPWLAFTVECKLHEIPFAYQCFIHSDMQGTFQLMGWTAQNVFERERPTIRAVAETFRFPAAPVPVPPPDESAPAVPAPSAPPLNAPPSPDAAAPSNPAPAAPAAPSPEMAPPTAPPATSPVAPEEAPPTGETGAA